MKLNLNYWQIPLLFIPFAIGTVIEDIPYRDLYSYQTHFAIANFFLVLNLCILISYQTYLVVCFHRAADQRSKFFQVNALIPLIFFVFYLLLVAYGTFIKSSFHNPKYVPGPLKASDFNFKTWTVSIFLVHAFITYFFINNQFVSRSIKDVVDTTLQEQLKRDYLSPMRRLVRVTFWMGVTVLLLDTIYQIIKTGIK